MLKSSHPGTGRVKVLNASIDSYTLDACVDDVITATTGDEQGWLATVNVAILMAMRRHRQLQSYADRARWVVADGEPLVWLSRLLGRPLPERVTGVDLLERLCGRAEQAGIGVYFLGATHEVITGAGQAMLSRYPRLQLHVADGYFTDGEAPARARAIAESGALLLFVGMGFPRQEQFIETNLTDSGVSVAIGVGGSFDVIGGLRRRAPQAMQQHGLEWVFRLIQEPQRLWRRYLVTGVQFGALSVLLLARAMVTRRRGA